MMCQDPQTASLAARKEHGDTAFFVDHVLVLLKCVLLFLHDIFKINAGQGRYAYFDGLGKRALRYILRIKWLRVILV